MLRVAVVGLGNIGKTHSRYYSENPDAELVALCDIDAGRVDPVAKTYGVLAYHDLGEMLAAERPDAVSIATAGPENGGHHYEPTMQAIEAGVHVLVEKPISNNIEHAREMVRAARERGVLMGVNLNHRFTPAAERAKKLQKDGTLGEVLFLNMALWINNPNESSPWFHLRALHPHSIDVMRYFGGPITKVQAFCHKGPGRQIWSNASVNVQFASGAVGHLTGSYDASGLHPIERCEVGGSAGRLVIENVYQKLEFFPRTSPEKLVVENSIMGGMGTFNETFRNRINAFVSQVSAGGPLDASGEDGLAAQEVIEAAIRSFENGTIEEVAG
ncbi:Predicted dehydrogenase [Actinopolymorpha cephalotaxi]|uniref:Dehydrogenase n=1 Tax=Actinopolymorpha cephalotaxi TaxID=504797 RepID=A0A1I2M5Q1_9ACTN|nr:Gfo/Idh/MocA family oxidoreductase [Actinopolymorpha cephalotaxi]NYH81575.1 putative dehydrogenase [Actinopolymorpha cephalotaxi]SFF86190.1 Predicted dehydrogenase [Actinopolymorpha cephalotaxi]